MLLLGIVSYKCCLMHMQHARKVVPTSAWLLDFVIGLVDSDFYLLNRQVKCLLGIKILG